MRRKARQEEIFFGYEILEISKLGADEFLASDIPGEIVLAVLADFGTRPAELVIQEILLRLQEANQEKSELEKSLQQLLVYSNISNLVELVRTKIETMPLTIDIRKSSIYRDGKLEGMLEGKREGMLEGKREGMLEGKREGMLEGKREGKEENQKRIVLAMIDAGKYSNEEISSITGASEAYIIALREQKS
jgi:predicted transposase YdaD